MANLATTQVAIAGTNQALVAAAAGGDTVKPGEGVFLVVKNSDATSKNVTLVTPGNLETGDAYPDKSYTVPAGQTWFIPIGDVYRDPTTGRASITYSGGVTSLTVGAYQA